jgi:AcrR family transcriptional regulator
MVRFAERVRGQLREELLDAAYDAMVAGGYDGLRMGEIAARTGVSRQTVYNELGDKWGVLQALATRETERFLVRVSEALTGHDEPIDALRTAVERALTLSADNPLIKAALSAPGAGQASQLLTTKGEQVLRLSQESLGAYVREHWPHLAPDDVTTCVDIALRVVLSHIVSPAAPPADVADRVARVLGPFLHQVTREASA